MNSVGNPENYRIFPANPKMDGMEGQSYFDRFPRHHISFSYRLPYLPNNTKMTEKYKKTEPVFPGILPTVFTLTDSHLSCLLLGCLFVEAPCMCQCCVFTCQSVSLIGLDCYYVLGARHLHSSIGSVDDRCKLQEERSFEDAVVAVVEAGNFEC
jgi:GT2 family glycosyltransferase